MKKLFNHLVVLLLKAFSHLPFWVIYLISDFFFLILFYVVGYRKRVVYTNLRHSFPEKGEKEIDRIARQYYRHFGDIFLESLKLGSMTEKQLDKRLVLTSTEKFEKYYRQGKSIIALCMHYNNWEWCSSMQRNDVKHQIVIVYNTVRNNPEMERFLLDMRERFGSETVTTLQAPRRALQSNRDGKPICLVLAADQTPAQSAQLWTTFLNQETPFFAGAAKIAIKTNQPVFYLDVKKTGRGKYHADIIELVAEPARETEESILLKYVEQIEKTIRETPQYWLWSHRRWKHQRPENTPLIPRNTVNNQKTN